MKNLEQLEECLQCGDYKNLIAGTEIPPMIKGVYLKTGQGILQAKCEKPTPLGVG